MLQWLCGDLLYVWWYGLRVEGSASNRGWVKPWQGGCSEGMVMGFVVGDLGACTIDQSL